MLLIALMVAKLPAFKETQGLRQGVSASAQLDAVQILWWRKAWIELNKQARSITHLSRLFLVIVSIIIGINLSYLFIMLISIYYLFVITSNCLNSAITVHLQNWLFLFKLKNLWPLINYEYDQLELSYYPVQK